MWLELDGSRSKRRKRWINTQGSRSECRSARELSQREVALGSGAAEIKTQHAIASQPAS